MLRSSLPTFDVDAYEPACFLASNEDVAQYLSRPKFANSRVLRLCFSPCLYSSSKDRPTFIPTFYFDLAAKFRARHPDLDRHRETAGPPRRNVIAVHVRQGDCTWIEHEGSYFFTGMRAVTSEPNNVNLLRAPDPVRLMSVLDLLLKAAPTEQFDIAIYSDGVESRYNENPGWLSSISTTVVYKFLPFLLLHNRVRRLLGLTRFRFQASRASTSSESRCSVASRNSLTGIPCVSGSAGRFRPKRSSRLFLRQTLR